jgi:mannosyltransferase OCH1-like enzyme
MQYNIPKKIYQTWETKNLSEYFLKNIEKWKILNPEYEFTLYDSMDRRNMVSNFGERYLKVYDRILAGALKCDMWRYIVLYLYGGFATDLDVIPINPIDNFLNNNFLVCASILNVESQNFYLLTGFIGIIPKHPIMLWCIERICDIVENNKPYLEYCDFTGPGCFGRGVNAYLKRQEIDSFVTFKQNCMSNDILFLNFNAQDFSNFSVEKYPEYIYDDNGKILAQNKNGNIEMIIEYRKECQKNNVKSWLVSKQYL